MARWKAVRVVCMATLVMCCGAITAAQSVQEAIGIGITPSNLASPGLTMNLRIPPIPSQPFSAKFSASRDSLQPDGTTTKKFYYAIVARDSKGRVHNENRTTSPEDPTGTVNFIVIYDPTTQLRTLVYPKTQLAKSVIVPYRTADTTREVELKTATGSTLSLAPLGTKSADGLQLTGVRETETFVADEAKQRPTYTVVTEAWYSAELEIVVSVNRTDSRGGEQTTQLRGLQRGEPDAALFEVSKDFQSDASKEPLATSDDPATPFLPSVPKVIQAHNISAAHLLTRVNPVYPDKARRKGIEGVVKLHAIIQKDGSVGRLEVLSGDPLLTSAAIKAVKKWRYSPTLLDAKPVEVDTTINVVFALNGQRP